MNIQEKTFKYFTGEDWLKIKKEYISDTEPLEEIEKHHLLEFGKDAAREEGNLIRQTLREELKNL